MKLIDTYTKEEIFNFNQQKLTKVVDEMREIEKSTEMISKSLITHLLAPIICDYPIHDVVIDFNCSPRLEGFSGIVMVYLNGADPCLIYTNYDEITSIKGETTTYGQLQSDISDEMTGLLGALKGSYSFYVEELRQDYKKISIFKNKNQLEENMPEKIKKPSPKI